MVLLIQEDFVLFNKQIHNPNVINREYYLVRLLITKTKFVPPLKVYGPKESLHDITQVTYQSYADNINGFVLKWFLGMSSVL